MRGCCGLSDLFRVQILPHGWLGLVWSGEGEAVKQQGGQAVLCLVLLVVMYLRDERRFMVYLRDERWRRQWHPTPVLLPGKSHGLPAGEGVDGGQRLLGSAPRMALRRAPGSPAP